MFIHAVVIIMQELNRDTDFVTRPRYAATDPDEILSRNIPRRRGYRKDFPFLWPFSLLSSLSVPRAGSTA